MKWHHERRRAYRVMTPAADAICQSEGLGDRYVVEDLSLGGACLRLGRHLEPGSAVSLLLISPSFGSLELAGTVAHLGRDGRSVGVRFEELDPLLEEVLDDAITDLVIEDYTARLP